MSFHVTLGEGRFRNHIRNDLLGGGGASDRSPEAYSRSFLNIPRGSRYLIIKELGLEDHDYYGSWGLSP